ncbi:hypothetical protein IU433_10990 [Nocardia puris]|uniref:Uncharacterized protein n=1 Tax=Nocardia puris TaxID=208602 RepID=A0A366DQT5_9NOCA|nr:hypothetical protein [Nocardia puris]MBF6211037.1 hypothetical protein [Nocardia puris]MBF6364633.1 hypothetical protein [Nocardia puris]MBF6459562.1 hypothetical protein [Nocardia puris]RBO92456.1 hypothetical protein DFR74_10399 [Nocardia puris]
MSRQRFFPRRRGAVAALFAAIVLGLATPVLPAATAAPGPAQSDPFAGLSGDTPSVSPERQEQDEKAEKAEKLGGGVTTKVIDLFTDVIKCGLNIATPAVKCKM